MKAGMTPEGEQPAASEQQPEEEPKEESKEEAEAEEKSKELVGSSA